MRISYNMLNQNLLNGLLSNQDKLANAENRATTGKAISKASDDPSGTARAMTLSSSVSQLDQMTSNGKIATAQLGLTDTTLSSISSSITQLRQLAVQGASTSLTTDGRAAIAAQLDQISDQLVTAGNTTLNGRYIFGGNKTSEKPIVANTADDAPYSYNGDSGAFKITISPGSSVTANISGDQVFNFGGAADSSTSDIFSTIKQLKADVLAGNVTAVSSSLTSIDANLTNVTTLRATVGARENRVTTATNQVADTKLKVQSMLSDTEDADLTQAITDVQTLSNTYQAAIATAQKVFSISLADYFK